MVTQAEIHIWGHRAGAVIWNEQRRLAAFEYDPAFLATGLELSPIKMPLRPAGRVYVFPELGQETFHGLPGLLADSLPDRYGNALIDTWLASQGRPPASQNPIERLCYLGTRGMGAMEFVPVVGPKVVNQRVEVDTLIALAQTLLDRRAGWEGRLLAEDPAGIKTLLQVGTSAGGARAKALIAYNPATHEVRSGQMEAGPGFSYWLIKFDGLAQATTVADPEGYGRIEYAYYHMAKACGIVMTECRLLEENGRAHFMTLRFDRTPEGHRLHMQTLCGMAHYDYNNPLAYSYEQAFEVMRTLRMPYADAHQLWLRMAFNVLALNLDDHTKNISFLLDPATRAWRLAPAYDVTYAYSSGHRWLGQHQLSVNGKRTYITEADLLAVAASMNIKTAKKDVAHLRKTLAQWSDFAALAHVPHEQVEGIGAAMAL
jgi:serine/threonine-protein kinase HipA